MTTIHKLNSKQQKWIMENIIDYQRAVRYYAETIILIASPEKNTYTFMMIDNTHNIVQCVFNANGKFWTQIDTVESRKLRVEVRNIYQTLPDNFFDSFLPALIVMDSEGSRGPIYDNYLSNIL